MPQHELAIGDLINIQRRHWKVWFLPTVAFGLVAAAYAFLKPDTWQASQALMVRNKAAGAIDAPGEFTQIEDMKLTQETLGELVKSQRVLEEVLKEVGPEEAADIKPDWPAPNDIADFRDKISVSPPKGAEFGKTEVFYLQAKAGNRERSVAVTDRLAAHLEKRFQELCDTRAQSMIRELEQAAKLAHDKLEEATEKLAQMEGEVGAELSELRVLSESLSNNSDVRQKLIEMEGELRRARQALREQDEMLALLEGLEAKPGDLVSAPNRLLQAHPDLRSKREALVMAQLKTSSLISTKNEAHPDVIAARSGEAEVLEQILNELKPAKRTVEQDRRFAEAQVELIDQQLADGRGRLERLAAMRARYSQLVAEVEHRTKLAESAEVDLANANADLVGSRSTTLVSRVDAPDPGSKPLGPGKAMILLAGLAGGFGLGQGLLFLFTRPPAPRPGALPDDRASVLLAEPAPAQVIFRRVTTGGQSRKVERIHVLSSDDDGSVGENG